MRARAAFAALACLAALASTAAAPAPAGAAIAFTPCTPEGFACGSLAVPLARGAAVPGSVALRVTRRLAGPAGRAGPTSSAVVGLAGGPGQAAVPLASDFADLLAPALQTRDLLLFDQRGTGGSGPLRCRALERGATSAAAVRACGVELGAARRSFRTVDSVADLEDVRREAGYERLLLVAVSYGTKVALDYAAAHPDRVEALVLDSVVPPEGWDPLLAPTLAAIPRALRALCAGGACRGITSDPARDLRALVRRAARRPLSGSVVDARGRRLRVELDPLDLFDVLLAGDANPTLRSDLPAALRSALRGDLRPVLRLRVRAAGVVGQPAARTRLQTPQQSDTSDALYAATLCGESRLPWGSARSVQARLRRARAAARRLPRAARATFGTDVALAGGAVRTCLGWPDTPAPSSPGPLPAVPTLLLAGEEDLRTPVENAQAVGARIAGARVVRVPFTGHSVLGSDLASCARGQLEAFLTGTPPAACAGSRPIAPAPVAPTSLARVPGASRAARTLTAVRATLADVSRQFLGDAVAAGRPPRSGSRVPGLRGGVATWQAAGVRLRSVSYVPGVTVSGLLRPRGRTSSLTVGGGAAARGVLRVDGQGRAEGRLGGVPVAGDAAGAARAATAVAGPRLG